MNFISFIHTLFILPLFSLYSYSLCSFSLCSFPKYSSLKLTEIIMVDKYVTLSNGVKMPVLGLGTYKNMNAESLRTAIVDLGIELIDTAYMYKNEASIGSVIAPLLKDSVPRDRIFLVTKIWPTKMLTPQDVKASFEKSLNHLQLDVIDLLLFHWPLATNKKESGEVENMNQLVESWKAMEELYKEKKVRAIGVSNFTIKHLEQFLPRISIPPVVNQFEMHPLLIQTELREYCIKHGIQPMAYRTLGQGQLLENEKIVQLAKKHSKTPAQVILRWALQRNFILIPKSSHLDRIKENENIWDFELSQDEINQINSLNIDHHYCTDPSNLNGLKEMVFYQDTYPKD